MNLWLPGGELGDRIVREIGRDVYTAVFKTENQRGPAVEQGDCSMSRAGRDGRGVWAECILVYVWLSPFAGHLEPPRHG